MRNKPAFFISKVSWLSRHESLLVGMITLLAGVLRLFRLGAWSFWVEEYHTIAHTQAIDSLTSLVMSVRPLFYLLEKPVFLLLGVDEWTTRLVPALIGILTIPLFFWAVRQLAGQTVALLSALLLAISPWHLYWSQNARFYTLFLLFWNLALLAFYLGIETDRYRYLLLALTATVMAVLTHGLGVILVPLFLAYFLALKLIPFGRPAGLRWRNLLPFVLLPLAGYVSLEFFIYFFTGEEQLYSILFSEFSKASGSAWTGYRSPFTMLTSTLYYLGTPLAILAVTGAAFLLRERQRAGLLLAAAAFGPLGLMMFFTLFASTANRYVFMTLPAWILLAAIAVQRLFERARRGKPIWPWVVVFLLVFLRDPVFKDLRYYWSNQPGFRLPVLLALAGAVSLCWLLTRQAWPGKRLRLFACSAGVLIVILLHPVLTDSLYFAFQNGHRDNWKNAVETINRNMMPGDVVVASIPELVHYYLDAPVIDIRDVNLDNLPQGGHRVWVVEDFGLYAAAGPAYHEWAQKHCRQVGNWDEFTAGVTWRMRVDQCDHPLGNILERP